MQTDSTNTDTTTVIDSIKEHIDLNLFQKFSELLELTLFSIQGTPITLTSILMFVLFLVTFSVSGKVLSKLLFKRALQHIEMDPGIRFALMRFTNYTIVFVGVVISFQYRGIILGFSCHRLDR
jgi:small-conductance mechanosensitive channel